jgi:hypothetical protein
MQTKPLDGNASFNVFQAAGRQLSEMYLERRGAQSKGVLPVNMGVINLGY